MSDLAWEHGRRFWAVDYDDSPGTWDLHMGGEPEMLRRDQDEGSRVAVVGCSLAVMGAIVGAMNEQAERKEGEL